MGIVGRSARLSPYSAFARAPQPSPGDRWRSHGGGVVYKGLIAKEGSSWPRRQHPARSAWSSSSKRSIAWRPHSGGELERRLAWRRVEDGNEESDEATLVRDAEGPPAGGGGAASEATDRPERARPLDAGGIGRVPGPGPGGPPARRPPSRVPGGTRAPPREVGAVRERGNPRRRRPSPRPSNPHALTARRWASPCEVPRTPPGDPFRPDEPPSPGGRTSPQPSFRGLFGTLRVGSGRRESGGGLNARIA